MAVVHWGKMDTTCRVHAQSPCQRSLHGFARCPATMNVYAAFASCSLCPYAVLCVLLHRLPKQ